MKSIKMNIEKESKTGTKDERIRCDRRRDVMIGDGRRGREGNQSRAQKKGRETGRQ